jgi:hypothetical protein
LPWNHADPGARYNMVEDPNGQWSRDPGTFTYYFHRDDTKKPRYIVRKSKQGAQGMREDYHNGNGVAVREIKEEGENRDGEKGREGNAVANNDEEVENGDAMEAD